MRSSKQHNDKSRRVSSQFITRHQRLHHALNLGTRYYDDKKRRWKSTDIEIQRLVIRSMSSFVECISAETLNDPLVKDSVADMLEALEGVLELKNEPVLSMAADLAIKLVKKLPNSMLQPYVADLVHHLSSLLSSRQLQVAISCTIALNLIISNLSTKRRKEIWEVMHDTQAVNHVVGCIKEFSGGTMPIEYLQEMASLLGTIQWNWPPSRYPISRNVKLMKVFEAICSKPDASIKAVVLRFYSTLALCGEVAKKLLENGEGLVQMMVNCMANSNPQHVRMEAFKLAQCLAIAEEGCLKMMQLYCGPIVEGIISGMSNLSLHDGKIANSQMSLLLEACCLVLVITRWKGEHHFYFWKLGIDRALVSLVFEKCFDSGQHFSSVKEQIATVREHLTASFLPVLRPYIWDILGSLSVHCEEDFNSNRHGNESSIGILITCACLTFVDSIRKGHNISQNEPASRAVLMMVYSPCNFIASHTRLILSEILLPNGKDHLRDLLGTLNFASLMDRFQMQNNLQIVIALIVLTCYSAFPQYHSCIIKRNGIKTLLFLMRWCLSNSVTRRSIVSHLHFMSNERTCCRGPPEEWDSGDILLFFSLWALSELIHNSDFSDELEFCKTQLITELEDIMTGSYAPGSRWYASYILSYFGFYGFSCKLGKRVGKALDDEEYSDMKLILTNGEFMSVHGVILMVRCPSLMPPENENDKYLRKEIHLSAHVDYRTLVKLLEFVYTGYLQAGEDEVAKLKTFAKRCNLKPLLHMLRGKSPKWGTPYPDMDLTLAQGPSRHRFWDVIMEAKASEEMHWTCDICSLSVYHIHAHKVILSSSCDYLRAMFQSGMQESHSRIIKVPISPEALTKLVQFFYSDELPKPLFGCSWNNMDTEEKLVQLQPYVELCWLFEFWLMNEAQEECSRMVISCLGSCRDLSIEIIQIAANLSQWKLAQVCANYMAPSFCQLRDSGKLDALDEELVDMVRATSVRFSQETH